MTAERRPIVPRGNPDPFVATLARILREIADREDAEAAERLERRSRMELVQGGKGKEDEAA